MAVTRPARRPWREYTGSSPLARGTLPQVWAMTLADLAVWAGEAVELYKALYGARRRR